MQAIELLPPFLISSPLIHFGMFQNANGSLESHESKIAYFPKLSSILRNIYEELHRMRGNKENNTLSFESWNPPKGTKIKE